MTRTKHLPLALILGFCFSLIACAQNSSSETSTPQLQPQPDPKSTWPIGPSTLNSSLLNEVIEQGVPKDIATLAFNKYDMFSGRVTNTNYMTIIDFTRHSGRPRLWMVDTTTGHVDALNVAHGVGSDPKGSGTPAKFSNVPNSKQSSLGSYLVSEKYQSSSHGTAMRLDGLESTNDLARDRAIVMHSAVYVSTNKSIMGMSWGCPAIALEWIGRALQRLSGGSFMFAYGQAQPTAFDEMQIQAIMTNPAYQWVNESEEAPVEGVF